MQGSVDGLGYFWVVHVDFGLVRFLVRRMVRILAAAGLSSTLAFMTMTPAVATAMPQPRNEQWWFAAWEIEDKVWPITKGAGVTIALIDSGVNAQLPDLNGVVVPGVNAETGGDGRADVDDEDGGHGTRMAALIASQGTQTGFVGVAPEVKIMPVVNRIGDILATAKSIRYAADHGAKVINISQAAPAPSGQCLPQIQDAIGYAIQRDVVVVAGAGNDGNTLNDPQYPANCAGVLAVGAIDNQKRAWNKSQRQSYVSVAAPGVWVGSISRNGRFEQRFGTSQASALTAAAAALVRSKFPQMSAREVVQRLINTTADAGPKGHDNMTGYGVIIPELALTANVSKSAPNPVFEKFDQWQAAQPKQTPNWTALPQGTEANEDSGPNGTLIVFAFFGGITILLIVGAVILGKVSGSRTRRGKGMASQQYGPHASQPGTPPSFGAPSGMPGPQGGPPPAPPGASGPQFMPPANPGGRGPSEQTPPPPHQG